MTVPALPIFALELATRGDASRQQSKQCATFQTVCSSEMYVFLRRTTSIGPFAAALIAALVLWAGVDEGVNTVFGFSAPPTAYPLATHLRGLAGHLALGFGTAIVAEVLFWSMERSPRH